MLHEFPDFRQIELNDAASIVQILKKAQPVISELTFANLYLWRHSYHFQVAKLGEGLAIRAFNEEQHPVFLPPVGVYDAVRAVQQICEFTKSEDGSACFCRVTEDMAHQLEAVGFHAELDRDNSDYVYLSDALANLSGRNYHRKRNQIAQFASRYRYEYRRVDSALVPECLKLQQTWCDIRDCSIPGNRSLAEENEAVQEALTLLDRLSLCAGAVLIEGKVVAFSIGGELNDETLVIHFEKANPAYPGLYQVINQEFCADVAVNYLYVNREQDLGDEGLRKAKESYFPHHMVYKYRVSL